MAESLGQAVLDLSTDNKGLNRGLDSAESTTKSRLGGIGRAIGKTTAAAGVAFAAAGGAAIGAAFKTAAYGDEVAKSAGKAGQAIEPYQELRFAFGQGGVAAGTFDTAMQKFNKRLGESATTGGTADAAFEALGISLRDADGNVRNAGDAMDEALPKLAAIESDAERAAIAGDLFGQRAGPELAAALSDGIEGIDEARQKAQDLGIVLDEEAAESAEAFTDSWDDIKQSAGGFLRQAAVPVMKFLNDKLFPVIQDGIGWLRDMFEVFQEGDGVVDGFKRVLGELAGDGPGIFQTILDAAKTLFSQLVNWLSSGGLQSILNWLLQSRMRLFEAAMQMFPAILDAAIQFIPQLIDFLANEAIPGILKQIQTAVPLLLKAAVALFSQLVDAVVTVLPDLLNTLLGQVLPDVLMTIVGMVPQLLDAAVEAFTTLLDAVIEILPGLIELLLGTVLPNLVVTIVGMVPKLLDAGITAFLALINAVLDVLPDLVSTLLVDVLPTLITTIVDMVPELLDAAIEAFTALVEAIPEILPKLIDVIIFELIPGVIEAVMKLVPELFEAGKEIIEGLIDGIGSMIGSVKDAIGNVVGSIRDRLPFSPAKEGPLHDNPPDQAGMRITEMITEGIASGEDDVHGIMSHLLDFADFGVGTLEPAMAGGDMRVVLSVDGRELAESVGPPLVEEVRSRTGL